MTDADAPEERASRGLGRARRRLAVIVLNDDHNTFEGVAFALAQTIPASTTTRDAAREHDPQLGAGGRLVRPSRARRALPLQLEGCGLTMAPIEQ
jgi:hypothetical protein